jgi:hypothetical protein
MTKVIFRVMLNGEVIALFPEIAGDRNAGNCMSYMHIGQHGVAYAKLDRRLATPEEYAPLLAELQRVGYDDLRVMKRVSPMARDIRSNQL